MISRSLQQFWKSAAPLTWLTATAAIIMSLVPGLPNVFEYDAAAIAHGEPWRILTGHLTHWGLGHFFWDVSVFLVLGTLCEWRSRSSLIVCIVGTAVITSCYMLVALPEIPMYRGLSGVDTGLFAMLSVGLYHDARLSRDRLLQGIIVGMVAALFAKLGYEVLTGTTIFVDQVEAGFIPIVAAHILGAVVGMIVGLIQTTTPFLAQKSHALTALADCRE